MARQLLNNYCMNTVFMINPSVGNVGTIPTTLKPFENPQSRQFTANPARNVPPRNTPNTATTDNTQPIVQKRSTDKRSQSFSDTLNRKTKTKASRNTQANKKKKKRDQSYGTFSKIHPAKSFTVQGTQTPPVVLDKYINEKVNNQFRQQVESRTTGKSAKLVAGSKAFSLIAQIAKAITNKPDQIVSTASKPDNKLIQTTIEQSHIKSEIILPGISNKAYIINAHPEKDQNKGKLQTSDKAFVTKDKLISKQSQQSGTQLISKTLISDNKTTADNKTTTDNKQPFETNMPSASKSSKTQLSNTQISVLGDKSSPSGQKVLIGRESLIQAVETGNKAETDQKDHHGKAETFELLEKNRAQVENLSVKTIAQQKMSSHGQFSATQAENRHNLLSNHASNPDTELSEQVLVGNNAQPAITEQSATSAVFNKIAGNADSGESVGEQIQESINSSFRLGNQQIVIRLNPPELGKVAIKFQEEADGITGLLEADKTQTRHQIQQALPEIIQNLQDCGIQIKRLEVVLTSQQESQNLKDHSSAGGQDGFSGQQSSPNPESQSNNDTYNEWLTNIDNAVEFAETQVQFTDSSINMLV
ncbi:MAG: hypothetical protein FVQ85_05380 [Planctomycetes bacterium]|nr:hypothetical protein [Planctomycetota bacterium]